MTLEIKKLKKEIRKALENIPNATIEFELRRENKVVVRVKSNKFKEMDESENNDYVWDMIKEHFENIGIEYATSQISLIIPEESDLE